MTSERARWILENPASRFDNLRYAFDHEYLHPSGSITLPQFADGITREEDEFIKIIWSMMGESGSYHNAIEEIAGR